MAPKTITKLNWKFRIKTVDFIEMSDDLLWYEIHLNSDKPQEPSFRVASTRIITFEGEFVKF